MYRLPGGKKILLTVCSVMLALPFSIRGYAFERFTMGIFRHELAGNTISLHYTLADPEAYGFREGEPSFGSFDRESAGEEAAYLQTCRKKLAGYRKWGLKEEDQQTAELLDWWLEGQILSEEYYYYQEPLGPTLGIQAQLPVLLAEYPFRKEEDVSTYLELLCRLPEYFAQIADFEREKSEQGLFMKDEILDKILGQCRSFFPVDRTHFLVTSFKERLEECDFLDSDQKIAYEVENLRNLNRYVEPAYMKLCSALEELRGTGRNEYGLYHTPLGIRYYEYLLDYSVGTDLGMAEIHRMLEERMESDYETILYTLQQDAGIIETDGGVPAEESPEEIVRKLKEQIETDFPQPGEIAWQIKEVPDSLSAYLSPAFYMTPAVDAPQQNVIYINPSRHPDRTELITTLAHEGYPGHLYQNSFENTEDAAIVRNLFYIGGYTEGWGLYSELYAFDFLGYTKTEGEFLRAMSSLNFAICAGLDLAVHGEGWTESECAAYLESFGIRDEEQVHELYLSILEEPSNYLKYYLGYLEICRLKESALALSSDLTLCDFHTWFLETGPMPFSMLWERLDAKFFEISTDLAERLEQNVHLFALETVHDGLNHLRVKSRMPLIGCGPFFSQRKKYHTFILRAADTGYIAFFHQIIDSGGQGSHGYVHGFRHGGHVFRFADADSVDNMHIVDGYFFKTAGDQCPVLHIQHFIEKHDQQIVQ